jgi:integrase/recombinase XerD
MARTAQQLQRALSRRGVRALWRKSGIKESSINQYMRWIPLFEGYCDARGLEEVQELTLVGVKAFVRVYCADRDCHAGRALCAARSSLRAWAGARRALGETEVPPWYGPAVPRHLPTLVREFAEYRVRHAGIAAGTVRTETDLAIRFISFLRSRKVYVSRLRLRHVDEFVEDLTSRLARVTVRDACSRLRGFLRFLFATGRIEADYAALISAPRVRFADRPPRALRWAEVRRILSVIDCRTSMGVRDYAAFLLMATYGMGAAEIITLRLEDVDWRAQVLRFRRPKTGVVVELPLLAAVSHALARYVRHVRPHHAIDRAVFVSQKTPHTKVTSSTFRQRLRHYASQAGIHRPVIGTHSLRHSYACRQADLGVPPKLLGDLLGHRHPGSTSVYIRAAMTRLRSVALPVPR